MSRKLQRSWIDEYIQLIADSTESPTKYHWWCAVTAIAAALKRHVWIDRVNYKLYPNLYTVLVGRPGLGKGAAMMPMLKLLKESGAVHTLSDRITMEFVLERLSKGFPATTHGVVGVKLGTEANALIVSSELSVFITASQFSITALSDLWDSKEGTYGYGTRGKGEHNIESPCVSLLGGSAQEWLVKSIPSDAVGGGFTRRVNFVLATKKDRKIAWPARNGFQSYDNLVDDLREMGMLRGEVVFNHGARQVFEDYYNSCEPDEFDDEASAVYKTSKWANAAKIAIALSVARGDSLEITRDDFQQAIDKCNEVAKDIPMVFRAVGESDLVAAGDKVLRFIEAKGYASRSEIIRANWRHVSSDDLDKILATFREGRYIDERQQGNKTLYFATSTLGGITP